MGQHRQSPRLLDQGHGLLHSGSKGPRHVMGTVDAENGGEDRVQVRKFIGVVGDKHVRDVGTPRHAPRARQHILPGNAISQRGQPLHLLLLLQDAPLLGLAQRLHDSGMVMVNPVAQEIHIVEIALGLVAQADLHRGDDGNTPFLGRGQGLVHAVHGIVVGDGQHAYAHARGQRHYLGRAHRAIGTRGVYLQVDGKAGSVPRVHTRHHSVPRRSEFAKGEADTQAHYGQGLEDGQMCFRASNHALSPNTGENLASSHKQEYKSL